MYAPEITQRMIEAAADTINQAARDKGKPEWTPYYCSLAEVDRAIAHLADLYDPEQQKLTRPLTQDESDFIQNERRICALDFRNYFASRYAWILNWDRTPQRFVPNVAQNIIFDLWAEDERRGNAIWNMNLKARRLGVSTAAELSVAHRFQFQMDANCVVASADPAKTLEMASMIKFNLDQQPWWLMPQSAPKIKAGIPVAYPDMRTRLTFQAGNQFTGVAQGSTPNVCHLCVAPQTLVRTRDGMLIPIVQVKPGDEVITHTGKTAPVRAMWKSERRHELASEIWLWGNFAPLTTTKDHRIWTSQEWIEAGLIKNGDWVRYPVRPITHERETFEVKQMAVGGAHDRPRRFRLATHPLSRAWGWLCGLYLAEGSIARGSVKDSSGRHLPNGVVFSGDLSEVDFRTEKLREAIGPTLNIGVQRSNSRTRILRLSNVGIARWIVAEFGETDSKRIPDWVWESGKDFAEGIVEGYLHGDGHYAKRDNEIYASSIRVQLPIQIRDLIASLGWGWSAIQYKSAGVYYERNCRAQWTLIVAGPTAIAVRKAFHKPVTLPSDLPQGQRPHWRYHSKNGTTWVEIEVEQVADAFCSDFYDLEVDDPDHSFTTAQCAISNSELALWQDADELIDIGLLPAIIDTPNVFGILESTGQGPGWWKTKWDQVKREWERGTARIRPVFLPWFVGTDLYPTASDLRKRPIPPNWVPDDRTIAHAERARQYVLANPLLFEHLAHGNRDWRLPREQMHWWEMGYQSAREEHKLHIFLASYCSDDFEAFQSQQNPLVDQEILIGYQERTRAPLGVYTIVGPDIPPALVAPPRYYDGSKPTITIATRDLLPRFDAKYQLIPLVFTGYPNFDEQLKLLIWEWPQAFHAYGIGVDCSEGVGQDNAVIEVLREATPMREPGQVAEWASNTVTAFQLWPLTLALGCLYSTINPSTNERKQCRMAIETWTNGAAAQNEIQKRGWSNFHPFYYAGDSRKPKRPGDVNRIGVMTNAYFRASMQDLWLTCLSEEAIDIPSPYLVSEITTLENVNGKAQAMLGEKDDRWMALGFPLLSLHMNKPPGQQFTRRRVSYQPGLEDDPGIPHPVWTPPLQASSTVGSRPASRIEQRLLRIRDKGVLDRYRNPNLPVRFR